MDELCETLDARAAARAGAEAGASDEMAAGTTATPPEESEEVREQHRRLLAEIRSCFRLLSIHSRLSGSESPRTRRMSTQTESCESLHSLAAERAKGNSPRVLRGLEPTEDVQNSLLYNQLISESAPSVSDESNPSSSRTTATSTAGLSPHLDDQGGGGDEEEEVAELTGESIYQRALVNPTSRLRTVLDLSKADVINVVEWLYRDHPGAVWRAASRKAMEDQEDNQFLTYGEVSFIAFANLLEKYAPSGPLNGSSLSVNQENGKVVVSNTSSSSRQEDPIPRGFTFYDLGCGAGRPVYIASLMNTSCAKSYGIEIVPNMHEMNKVLLRLYNLEVQPNLHPQKQLQKLDFLLGDFLQIDWSDADIIFTNATCFRDSVFRQFEEMAAKVLKPGAIVISVARRFGNLDSWELLERQERQMSWAPALVFVYRKKAPNQSGVDSPSTSTVSETEVVP